MVQNHFAEYGTFGPDLSTELTFFQMQEIYQKNFKFSLCQEKSSTGIAFPYFYVKKPNNNNTM